MFSKLRQLKLKTKQIAKSINIRWYHLYFFLAAFDLITIGLTLCLNHNVLENYSHAVKVNEAWVETLSEVSKLAKTAGVIDNPPNSIFKTHDVVAETFKLNQAITNFNYQFSVAQSKCIESKQCADSSPRTKQSDAGVDLSGQFTTIRRAANLMITESQQTLDAYARHDQVNAGRHMATTDEYFTAVLTNIEKFRIEAGKLQGNQLANQLQQAEGLRALEYLLGMFVLLIVAAVATFGHRIMRNIQALESKTREQYKQIEGLIDNINGVACRFACDNDLTMLYVSKPIEEFTGYVSADFMNNVLRNYREIIHVDDQDRVTQVIFDAIRSNKSYEVEYRIVHKDGFVRWGMEKGRCIEAANGELKYLDAIIFDITMSKVQKIHSQKMKNVAEASEKYLAEIFNSATDAIVITNSSGNIMRVNPAALSLFQYELQDVVGKNISILIDQESENLSESLAGVQLGDVSIVNGKRSDDSIFPIDMSYNENIVDGNVTYTAVFKDSPLRKQYEKSLMDAKDRAEEVGNLKMQFLANMSHEIRTPLNGIIGMLELFEDTEPSYEQRDFLDTIRSSSETLLGIINDILDLSKIESGKLALETIPFYPAELVEDVVKLYQTMASKKGIKVEGNFDINSMGQVMGDPLRTKQIIGNLLNNALKFTQEGGVEVKLTTEKVSDSISNLTFEVKDTGIGIKADVLPRLFEKFSQADSSTTRKFGGTGLGLSIVHSLVEIMGGEITAESVYGEGTTFRVTLPYELPELALNTQQNLNPVLLIAEEIHPISAMAKQLLGAWNLPFLLVTPEQLESNLSSSSGMPWSVCILIGNLHEVQNCIYALDKQLPNVRRIGIMLDSSCEKISKLDACFDGSFRKSVLLNTINALAFQKVKSEAPMLPKKYNAKILLVEDVAVNQKVAMAILKKLGITPDLAENGQIAVEMVSNNDYDLVLMDCQMPIMDGYTATKTIRELGGSYEKLPILALTAHAFVDEKKKCLDAGMSDYLSKPIKIEELSNALNSWLSPQVSEVVSV